jgi:hypothetical protein
MIDNRFILNCPPCNNPESGRDDNTHKEDPKKDRNPRREAEKTSRTPDKLS